MPQTDSQPTSDDATGLPGVVERARGLMLEAVIEPVLATLGFELVDLEWSSTGRQRKLQVYIDRAGNEAADQTANPTGNPTGNQTVAQDGAANEAPAAAPTGPTGGIDLQDCARLSPIISNALDAAEVASPSTDGGELARLLASHYVLEVSSPGLERPLSRRSHYERFVGRLCKLRVFSPLAPGDAQRNFHGRIEAVSPDPTNPQDDRSGIVTLRDPDGGLEHRIPIDRVRRARLVFEG